MQTRYRDDDKVKVNVRDSIPTSFYTTVHPSVKRCRNGTLYIIPSLFAYFLACHPYIFLCFYLLVRESVDSLCRDGGNAQYMQYLSKSRINAQSILPHTGNK